MPQSGDYYNSSNLRLVVECAQLNDDLKVDTWYFVWHYSVRMIRYYTIGSILNNMIRNIPSYLLYLFAMILTCSLQSVTRHWAYVKVMVTKLSVLGILTITLLLTYATTFTLSPPAPFTLVWAQQIGLSSLFPNATTPITGNRSIIPGILSMSLVDGVKFTWKIISSDNEFSLTLRYTGNGISPAISLIATALKTTSGMEQTLVANASFSSPSGFQRLSSSNVTNSGWISPATMPIKVQGGISLLY